MPTSFTIQNNNFLTITTPGYYNCIYTGYRAPGNPDFINKMKNTFNNTSINDLYDAKEEARKRIKSDLTSIIASNGISECTIVCIPRAKAYNIYTKKQLFFIDAVSEAADEIKEAINGVSFIRRIKNTKTTHLSKSSVGYVSVNGQESENDGDMPYPGITKDTCTIYEEGIRGKTVILVDDIYTKTCNIDEDCIQALYDAGAEKVFFYAIGYTKHEH